MAEETNDQKPQDQPYGRRRFQRYHRRPRPQQQSASSQDPTAAAQSAEIGAEAPVSEPVQQPQKGGSSHSERLDVSVVIPLLNEEQSLKELTDQLKISLVRMGGHYELIFIDDGSTDNSFRVLRDLHFHNRRIKVIRFRRNYGKSAALMVGFQKAQGEFVVTMDADLQDDPAEIPNLIKQMKTGYDVVSGWKKKRHDPISKTIPSRFFNFVTALVTGIKIHDFNCGLKAYRRDVVKSVNVYGELHRYIPVLAYFQGFRIGEIVVQHHARKYGKTKFGISRFFKGFLDLLTVIFTTRYITRPLHLFGLWGMAGIMTGTIIDTYLIYEKIFKGEPLSNRPLFLLGLILIIVGVQVVSTGLLGEMITRGQHAEREYSVKEVLK
jgi:glycosyltransferase involved in cell wall biosynthesis